MSNKNNKKDTKYINENPSRLNMDNNHQEVDDTINSMINAQEENQVKAFVLWFKKHWKPVAGIGATVALLILLKGCPAIIEEINKDKDPEESMNPGPIATATIIDETNSPVIKESEPVYSLKPTASPSAEPSPSASDEVIASETPSVIPSSSPSQIVTVPPTVNVTPSVEPTVAPTPMPINPTVHFSTTTLTNGNVIVTITSEVELLPVEGWTLSTDKKQLTKTYEQNIIENVTLNSLEGSTVTLEIKINNIDKTFEPVNVEYSLKDNTVTVKIKSNEELQPINGWTLSTDKKTLSKTYTSNTKDKVVVKDKAGNKQAVEIKVEGIVDRVEESYEPIYTPDPTDKPVIPTQNPSPSPSPDPTPTPSEPEPTPTPESSRNPEGGDGKDQGGDGYGDGDDIIITYNSINTRNKIIAYKEMREFLLNGVAFTYEATNYQVETPAYKLTM